MLKINILEQPIYVLEALNFLGLIANGEIFKRTNSDILDMNIADDMVIELNKIKKAIKPNHLSLFKFMQGTKASLATCLLNSFGNILEMEKDDYVESIVSRINVYKNKRIEAITIEQHLDIDDSSCDHDFMGELLALNLQDSDMISLLKALNDPKRYLTMIMDDIYQVIPYFQELFVKYQDKLDLGLFDENNTLTFLSKINCKLEGNIDIIPTLVHYHSLMINIKDKDDSNISMHCGMAINVAKLLQRPNFDDDMESKLESFIKVLSDKSKLKILELLKEQEMYGAQLAKVLQLKTPTISYHIDALMNVGLVSARRINNRMHYTYNKEACLKILDYLRNKLA
ncbi:MAG: winged helix-turn-helix domain-containing protein [Erysipelotrichaceae bacterium]|nr:winged helix-turn-helix domain-containing protein [Erysipelotrichaceae bacterium]MDY5251639.1 winged helix-turn-helix domain-containing protein [Erysipelotrichaceae bacterium]